MRDCKGAVHAPAAGASLPAISKVLRTLKHTEDATAEPATEAMYLLCDAALVLARDIVDRRAPGASDRLARYPGHVPLPRYLFRQLDARLLAGEGFQCWALWLTPPMHTVMRMRELVSSKNGCMYAWPRSAAQRWCLWPEASCCCSWRPVRS